jgi:hypothetical protein
MLAVGEDRLANGEIQTKTFQGRDLISSYRSRLIQCGFLEMSGLRCQVADRGFAKYLASREMPELTREEVIGRLQLEIATSVGGLLKSLEDDKKIDTTNACMELAKYVKRLVEDHWNE